MARRFARVFEFSRDEDREGTPDQQAAVRDNLKLTQRLCPRFDRVLLALDRARNRAGRSFVVIQFVDLNPGVNGFGTTSTISFAKNLPPSSLPGYLLMHELGHTVGFNVLVPKDSSERWADEFQQWVQAGCPEGPTWDKLELAIKASSL